MMQNEAASRIVNIRFSGTEMFDNPLPLINVMMYLGGKGMLVSILCWWVSVCPVGA
jgi:hypothetical protein